MPPDLPQNKLVGFLVWMIWGDGRGGRWHDRLRDIKDFFMGNACMLPTGCLGGKQEIKDPEPNTQLFLLTWHGLSLVHGTDLKNALCSNF